MGELLYSAGQVQTAIMTMADAIAAKHAGILRPIVLVAILKGGAYPGMCLMRELAARSIPVRVDFLWLSSYADDHSTGKVKWHGGPQTSLKGETVLLVDDLVDTGLTLAEAHRICSAAEPASLEVCVIVEKQDVKRHPSAEELRVEYIGLRVPNVFIVGGLCMDFNEHLRSHPDIVIVNKPALRALPKVDLL
eukprot:NODE_3385_length_793_cov_778.420054.p1 GENE.NODE_3385_length_793_cov_778.420054~~NODE_3385_length_793_cov_778.420054.p1  ORF type:complete len:192 (-),score=53.81 NODE_3385_length_793_cov_778.420054:156-731(-)